MASPLAIRMNHVASTSGHPSTAGISLTTPVILSLLAGSATGIGGLVIVCARTTPSDRTIAAALAFAAGVMTCVSVLDLWWPLASRSPSAFLTATAWTALGAAATRLFQYVPIPDPDVLLTEGVAGMLEGVVPSPLAGSSPSGSHHVGPLRSVSLDSNGDRIHSASKRLSAWRLGFLLSVVLTIHNFPEGVLVGLGAVKSPELGVTLCIAIMLHNVAEGMVVAVPTFAGTGSKWLAFVLTIVSGMSEPLGAILGVMFVRSWFGSVLEPAINAALCAVGGIMIGVSFTELLPQAVRFGSAATPVKHEVAARNFVAFSVGALAIGLTMLVV